MKYTEFLSQPKITENFNSKFKELKNYFHKKFEKSGLSKLQSDVLSTKVALVNVDYDFSELFENENKNAVKETAEIHQN
jgi:hypothetical protein